MSSKKVLVLGANGMLGKMVSLQLKTNEDINVYVTSRNRNKFIEKNFNDRHIIYQVDSDYKNKLINLLRESEDKFDYIVNCIGVIKPKIDETDKHSVQNTILINSYLPNEIQKIASQEDIQFLQIGTDCVFSGDKGNYLETSFMDAEDLYGKTKIIGEIESTNKFLIRSSIIGPESGKGFSLMNWFLKNTNPEVSGYSDHLWNGVTTLNFSKVIEGIIVNNKKYSKISQHLVPKNTISKANLLEELKVNFDKDIIINQTKSEQEVNRTLLTNNESFNQQLWQLAGYKNVPTIEENINELYNSELTNVIMN